MTRKLGIAALAVLALTGTAACSSSGGGSAGGGDSATFCNEVKAQRDSDASRDSNSSRDPVAEAAAIDKLVSLSPSEIRKEMEQLRDFDQVASSASSDPSKSAEFESQLADIEVVVNKITDFVKKNCGIDLNATASSFSTVASSIN